MSGRTGKKLMATPDEGSLVARGSEAELRDGTPWFLQGRDGEGATYGRVKIASDEDHDIMQVYRYDNKTNQTKVDRIYMDNEMDEDFFTKGAGQGYQGILGREVGTGN